MFVKIQTMYYFYERLKEHIEKLNASPDVGERWTFNLIARKADIPSGHPSLWKKEKSTGGRSPTAGEVEKISKVQELGLSLLTLTQWRLIDEYGIDAVEAAYNSEIKPRLKAKKKG